MNKNAIDLTKGSPGKGLLLFAIPMILGNLFQQFYNMVDTIIVGKYAGENALAAVWYAVPIGWAVNYLISGCRYLTGRWMKKKLV